jgi:hypothetical protein
MRVAQTMLNRVQKEKTALQQELEAAKADGQEVDSLKLKLAQLQNELAEVSDSLVDGSAVQLIRYVSTAFRQTRRPSNQARLGLANERDDAQAGNIISGIRHIHGYREIDRGIPEDRRGAYRREWGPQTENPRSGS